MVCKFLQDERLGGSKGQARLELRIFAIMLHQPLPHGEPSQHDERNIFFSTISLRP